MTCCPKSIIADILKAREDKGGIVNVYYVACGGSYAGLHPGKYFLQSEAKKVTVDHYTANEFCHATPKALGPNSIVITQSHSGTTPETVKAAEIAQKAGAASVVITFDDQSPLAKNGDYVLKYEAKATADMTGMAFGLKLAVEILNQIEGYENYDEMMNGFDRIDGLMGLGVAAFILYSGAMLVKDTIDPLLGAAPDPELVEHIEKKALSYPGVLGVHDLMIHDYGPGSRLVSFHLEMDAKDDVMHSHDVIDRIERDLLVEDGVIATVHFDPIVTGDAHVDELKTFLQNEVKELEPLANIHDLRIVPGPTHTNVIFDCAVPAEYMADKQHRGVKLVNALRNSVQAKWPDHFCVIKLEPDYAPVHHEGKT